MDTCAVGGDKVNNALWRAREGGAVEALAAAGKAVKTDVFIMLGINDVTMRADSGTETVISDVVGGVFALATKLKTRIQGDYTMIHWLEVPMLPMYQIPGNEGMREEAEYINDTFRKISARFTWLKVHGWGNEFLYHPEWLISPNNVHLNTNGYIVFARLLRSLILQQKDFEDGEVNPSKEKSSMI